MKMLLVEWVDSASVHGWHRFSPEEDKISHCISIGMLIHEDEKQIVLCPSRSDYGNVADTCAIPKISIKRIRKLRVKED